MESNSYPVKKNAVYPLEITSLAFGGKGVARMDDYVIFVKQALPGDIVNARIIKRKSSYAEAIIESFSRKSDQRIEAPCKHFDYCGGCTWQNLDYTDQLLHKTHIVKDAIKHISGLENCDIRPIKASARPFHYRNKMEFSFADRKWLTPDELGNPDISKDFALGLHVPGTFDKILHIEKCLLQTPECNDILEFISHYAKENDLKPYGIKSHNGFLRFLVIRQSYFNKEIMVNIVTAYEDNKVLIPLALKLQQEFPLISSIVNNVNTRKAQIAQGEKEILLAGKDHITDKIGPFEFNISANSFFQTNTKQAAILYDTALDFAELQENDTVWDLYSGTGTISLYLAQKAKQVTGFEIAESAIQNACQNAAKYKLENINFIAGDVVNNMQNFDKNVQVIVTDPPRSGMHEKVVQAIMESGAEKVVYVSCNPTTMARDLKLLNSKYNVDIIQPVDMFPQTYHIECVTRLSLK